MAEYQKVIPLLATGVITIYVQDKPWKCFAALCGGFARVAQYPPKQLSAWSSMGGKALLRKRGRGYFRELQKKRRRRRPRLFQPSPRVTAAKLNGSIGRKRRAQLYSVHQRSEWSRLGGLAVLTKLGRGHFRRLRELRTRKDARKFAGV